MSTSSPSSTASNVLFAAGLLILFGFLVVILANFAEKESLEERAYRGDFDAGTIATRWENLEEVTAAQAESFDEAKVAKAMAAVAGNKVAPVASEIVVPGSATFMKQMEDAPKEAEASDAEKSAPAAAPAGEVESASAAEATPAESSTPASGKPKAETPGKNPASQQ